MGQMKIAYNNVQGFGLAKQKLLQHILEKEKLDMVLVTESKRNIDHPVTEIHPDYSWLGKNRTKGNGGGLGIMYNRNYITLSDDNLLNSMNDNYERMWVAAKICGTDIAIGVTYFPQDNVTSCIEEASKLHTELLDNIGHIQSKYDNIILLGDFNGKIHQFREANKQSSNGLLVENLAEASDMNILNLSPKCKGRITWTRGPQASTIDYVLCSEVMGNLIESVLIDEDKEYSVGSDHNFMVISGHLPTACGKKTVQKVHDRFTQWNIKDQTKWSSFKFEVDNCFFGWNCNEFDDIDDMWASFKLRLLKAGEKSIGHKKYSSKRAFWDNEVHQLIQDRRQANRLYRIWARHPNCSPELLSLLWDDYQELKQKVANKVRQKAITNKVKIITENASKATTNPRAFWNMLKKLNSSNDYPLRIRDPDNPDMIIDDPVIIKKKLTSYWAKLGSNDQSGNEALLEDITSLETKAPSPDSLSSVTIDQAHLKRAISKLKNGKAMGTDSIPGEFIKYGGDILHNALLQLLQKIKLFEKLPEQWYEGIIKPIFKEGNREVLSNYRGITISCVCYKILVCIIEEQVTNYAEDKDIYGEGQGAFRKGRRCEDNIFSLKGICSIRKSKKQKTYLAFIDVSKAFDTVDRCTLFHHIWQKGVQGKMWRIIRMLYRKVDNKVIFGSFQSESFLVNNGVKQGCVLSPTLFNMVIEDLDTMLNQCNGIHVGDYKINGLYYADDVVLMANNETDLQDMLNIAGAFGEKWGLKFNNKKSQVMIIGKRWSDKQWHLGGLTISEAKCYKYLGVMINRHLTDTNHINDHLKVKADKLQSYLRFTLARHYDINRFQFGDSLWRKAILPSLAHASGIWFDNTATSRKNIRSFQYKMAKAVLKINSTPSITATLGELGWLPFREQLDINRVAYYSYVSRMPETRITKIVYRELENLDHAGTITNFKYIDNIRQLFVKNGLDHMHEIKDDVCPMQTFKQFTYSRYMQEFNKDIAEYPSLQLYRMVKESTFAPEYIKSGSQNFKWTQLKFRLRTGVSSIGEDLHRQHREQGLCKHCGQFESKKHFIFQCTAYTEARQCLYKNIRASCDSDTFSNFLCDQTSALYALLGDHEDVFNGCFLEYLSKAWTIRQAFE